MKRFTDWFAGLGQVIDDALAESNKAIEDALAEPLSEGATREVTSSTTKHADGGITQTTRVTIRTTVRLGAKEP